MTLDELPLARQGRIVAVDWNKLVPEEARRLRALGIDVGACVHVAQRGVFGGRDPVALQVGRMVVALRRAHAEAFQVDLDAEPGEQSGVEMTVGMTRAAAQ